MDMEQVFLRELPFASLRDIEDVHGNTDLPLPATHYVNIHPKQNIVNILV